MSKTTISHDKKQVLSDLVNRLGREINVLYHSLEEDETIPNDKFKVYEKLLENLYELHTQLEEEVIFS